MTEYGSSEYGSTEYAGAYEIGDPLSTSTGTVGFGNDGFGFNIYGSGTQTSGYNAAFYGTSGYGRIYTDVNGLTRRFLADLPDYYVTAPDSGNYNLLWAAAHGADTAGLTLQNIDFAASVQNATTIDQLEKLGALVNTPPLEGEQIAEYRARLRAEYAVTTSEATVNDVINGTAEILDIRHETIKYNEPSGSEYGTVDLQVPNRALEESSLTLGQIGGFIDRLLPASYRLVSKIEGTFTYITPSDYNLSNFDATTGYDGLDANGDPEQTGGTYGGLL